LIQNGCNIERPVLFLEPGEKKTTLEDFASKAIPVDFYNQLKAIQTDISEPSKKCKLDTLLKSYKVKSYSPFY